MGTPWHVAPVLGVSHVKNAVRHYTDALGFECTAFYPGAEAESAASVLLGGAYALLQRDGAGLHLQIRPRALYADGRREYEADAYFYVSDADALWVELAQRGARIVRKVEDGAGYGLRDFVVEDLDGNRLVFGSSKR